MVLSIISNERLWINKECVVGLGALMVLDLEVVTVQYWRVCRSISSNERPEVWGNTSKAGVRQHGSTPEVWGNTSKAGVRQHGSTVQYWRVCRSMISNERLWINKECVVGLFALMVLDLGLWINKECVVGLFALMVLDLEVVSLTLKLPEVWGNTSKAAKERRKERRWRGATQAKQVWSLTSLTLDYELIKNVYKQSS